MKTGSLSWLGLGIVAALVGLVSCSQGYPTSRVNYGLVPTDTPTRLSTAFPSPLITDLADKKAPIITSTLKKEGFQENDPLVSCVPMVVGTIDGNVTQAGKPVADGVFVIASFDGGPAESTRIRDGYYSLPLLARKCLTGLNWVGFQLRVAHQSQYVLPENAGLHRDIELSQTADISVPSLPACDLTLGSVTGKVLTKDTSAPDGTPIAAARVGPGTAYPESDPSRDILTQRVLTAAGQYTFISVGLHCDDGEVNFMPLTLFAIGVSIPVTPTQETTVQDIVVP